MVESSDDFILARLEIHQQRTHFGSRTTYGLISRKWAGPVQSWVLSFSSLFSCKLVQDLTKHHKQVFVHFLYHFQNASGGPD